MQNTFTINDPSTARVCTLAGIARATQELTTLQDLQRGIATSLRQLDSQSSIEEFMATSLTVLRLTKATCDAFITFAATLSGKGDAVSKAYGIASVGADAVGNAAAGGRVDVIATGLQAAKAGAEYAAPNAKYLTQNLAVKAQIVVAALNGDREALEKSALSYSFDLANYSMEQGLGERKAAGALSLLKALFEYNDAVRLAFDELIDNKNASRDRHLSGKSMLKRQTEQFQKKIDELIAYLEACRGPSLA